MVTQPDLATFTAFAATSKLASGSLADVARALKTADDAGLARLLVFNDASGELVELDLRGSIDEVLARLPHVVASKPKPAGRGRPRLGVTAREVTLLPSHWEWLARQPGGASATLRRLVDRAKRAGPDLARSAREAAHKVMFAIAGDAPRFEDATRAFYAGDYDGFEILSADWPEDVRDYVRMLVRRVADQDAVAGDQC